MNKLIFLLAFSFGLGSDLLAASSTYVVTVQFFDGNTNINKRHRSLADSLKKYYEFDEKLNIHRWVEKKSLLGDLIFQGIITGKLEDITSSPLLLYGNYKVIPLDAYYFQVSHMGSFYRIANIPLKHNLLHILESNNFDFFPVVRSIMGDSCIGLQSLDQCMSYLALYFWNQNPNMANFLWVKIKKELSDGGIYHFFLEAGINTDEGHPFNLILDGQPLRGEIGSIPASFSDPNNQHQSDLAKIRDALAFERKKRNFYKLLTLKNEAHTDHSSIVTRLHTRLNKMGYKDIYQLKTPNKKYFLVNTDRSRPISKITLPADEFHDEEIGIKDLYNFFLVLNLQLFNEKDEVISKIEYPINIRENAIEKNKKDELRWGESIKSFFSGKFR